MTEEELRQYKIQVCKLTAKLQYLCSVVNFFTKGYAKVELNKEWDNVKFEFASTKSDWESRYKEVRGDHIEENFYLCIKEDEPEWRVKNRVKVIPRLRAAIKSLEDFIENPSKFEFEERFNWYTETIKFKVFELDYRSHT